MTFNTITKDALNRVLYVKERVPEEVYNMFLVSTVQWEYVGKSRKINFNASDLELICRSLLAAIAQMETKEIRGWSEYMLGNHENIFLRLLRELITDIEE